MKKQIEQTLDSREVAEMVGKEHKNLVRDIRSYVEELSFLKNKESDSRLKIEPSDFFQENTYMKRGKEYPCFKVAKKGCEFIANKLTGIKGTEFTARYINRFHDMEVTIKDVIPNQKQDKLNRLPLSSVNMMVKNVMSTLEKAKVEPVYVAAEVKRLYTDLGYEVKALLLTDKETMPKLYDCTEMARELGIYSNSGKPHYQAVSAIIKKLHIPDSETVTTAFSRNGHDDVTIQYKPSVLEDVKLWLAENNYPMRIPYIDSKGNSKACTVVYQEVA
ncbi:Rha family transcriptional regulator [Clostridium sp. AM58-1XD]|uniref:Rha family transcriptional regulator n=1 Tax=Clostridium sp. AM58-1XD TaxID=2292307 RepID=UPI0015F3AFB8|nr:Rha family transcriptional regulator [Clostridium sp. AM58-1XD]